MDARFQRRIQRYGWDKGYWSRQLEPAQSKLLEMAALVPGERVLDVACGAGLVTFRAAELVCPSGAAVGTDISEKMVETARAEAARRGLNHVSFDRADEENLQLPENAFDAALCALGLMYVPEPATALGQMLGVLRPGGRAVAAVWGARRNCGWAEIFPIVDSRVKSEVCPLFFQLGTGDNLPNLFDAAGYHNVQCERIRTTLQYGSAEEACGAAFAGGPVALAYSRFDDRTREEAHAEYLASIEPFRLGDRYEIPGEFVIASGRKPQS
ncbi:MAG: class I SAM-dependent methyltransferase [Bryobacteraceae bacterium]